MAILPRASNALVLNNNVPRLLVRRQLEQSEREWSESLSPHCRTATDRITCSRRPEAVSKVDNAGDYSVVQIYETKPKSSNVTDSCWLLILALHPLRLWQWLLTTKLQYAHHSEQ